MKMLFSANAAVAPQTRLVDSAAGRALAAAYIDQARQTGETIHLFGTMREMMRSGRIGELELGFLQRVAEACAGMKLRTEAVYDS